MSCCAAPFLLHMILVWSARPLLAAIHLRLVEVVVSRLSSVPYCLVLTVVSWVVCCNSWPVDGFVNSESGSLRAFVLKRKETAARKRGSILLRIHFD